MTKQPKTVEGELKVIIIGKQKVVIDFDTIIEDKILQTNIEKFFIAYHKHDYRYTNYAVQAIENALLGMNGYALCYIGRHTKSIVLPIAFVGENHILYRWISSNILGNLSTGEYSFSHGMPCMHYTLQWKYFKKSIKKKERIAKKEKNKLQINSTKTEVPTKPKRKRKRKGGRRRNKKNSEGFQDLDVEEKKRPTKKTELTRDDVSGLCGPIRWLYTILVIGKYDAQFSVVKSVDEVFTSYIGWCKENDLLSKSKISWSKILTSMHKGVYEKSIYTSSIIEEQNTKTNKPYRIRVFNILPENECKELFRVKYEWMSFN